MEGTLAILIAVVGNGGDLDAIRRWAWLGNQDQHGGPTVWLEGFHVRAIGTRGHPLTVPIGQGRCVAGPYRVSQRQPRSAPRDSPQDDGRQDGRCCSRPESMTAIDAVAELNEVGQPLLVAS